jgi:putative endonuclease
MKRRGRKRASGRWLVYILECGDGTLYTGITNNVEARLKCHEAGTGARYTRGRKPLLLVYTEACRGKSRALKREYAIKRLSRDEKLVLINKI